MGTTAREWEAVLEARYIGVLGRFKIGTKLWPNSHEVWPELEYFGFKERPFRAVQVSYKVLGIDLPRYQWKSWMGPFFITAATIEEAEEQFDRVAGEHCDYEEI